MIAFFDYFILANFLASICILLTLLVKKALKKHISARWQYNLGLLSFALLVLPLLSRGFFSFFDATRLDN